MIGPAALVCANLIDLGLATKVFVHPDPLVGTLSFFVFGAATGVPIHLVLARVARGHDSPEGHRHATYSYYDKKAAAIAGTLAALATAAWLYALSAAEPALVFPLAHMTPAVFAIGEGLRGRVALRRVATPVLVVLVGLFAARLPAASVMSITPAIVLALFVRNAAGAGSEAVERAGACGEVLRFTAVRFVWLATTGIPIATGVALATGRAGACAELLGRAWILALPLHSVTMLLMFAGGVCRIRAKGETALTLCAAAYAAPSVLAPLTASVVNLAVTGFFPTVTPSARLLVGALLVVAGVAWLSTVCIARPSLLTRSRQ